MKKWTRFITSLALFGLLFTNGIGISSAGDIVRNEEIPVYSSVEEWQLSEDTAPIVRVYNKNARYQGGYAEYHYVKTLYSNDTRVGYHPDFDTWIYSDGYYFSSSKKSTFKPSFSVSWGSVVSVSISVAKSQDSGGFFRTADGSRRSRPWVRADIQTKVYDMYLYNEFGKLTDIYEEIHKVSTSSDIQIFIDYK